MKILTEHRDDIVILRCKQAWEFPVIEAALERLRQCIDAGSKKFVVAIPRARPGETPVALMAWVHRTCEQGGHEVNFVVDEEMRRHLEEGQLVEVFPCFASEDEAVSDLRAE